MSGKIEARERYLRWWKGKLVKPPMAQDDDPRWPKRVIDVEVYGPPSFVYGGATLIFDDGTEHNIVTHSFVPRKKDMIVVEDEAHE